MTINDGTFAKWRFLTQIIEQSSFETIAARFETIFPRFETIFIQFEPIAVHFEYIPV
jgi:hypothetical protein